MSTHYSLTNTPLTVDGVDYVLDKVNISTAFGPDLSHPWVIDFGLKANKEAHDALKVGSIVKIHGIDARVDAFGVYGFPLLRDTDALVTVGLMPVTEYA